MVRMHCNAFDFYLFVIGMLTGMLGMPCKMNYSTGEVVL
jgi:hypothetical protein